MTAKETPILDPRSIIQFMLGKIRESLREEGIPPERLPGWLRSARVETAVVGETIAAVIEDKMGGDAYTVREPLSTDTALIFRLPDFEPRGYASPFRSGEGHWTLKAHVEAEGPGRVVLAIPEKIAFFPFGIEPGRHWLLAMYNLFFRLADEEEKWPTPLAIRFIPFGLFIHRDDAVNLEATWARVGGMFRDYLAEEARSSLGDYYAGKTAREEQFLVTAERHVVVLGRYTPETTPELEAVRDSLLSQGYYARLLRDLPEPPAFSLEQKVHLWCLASRFSVMVDRFPSGHIAEFAWLKNDRTILAVLRPKGGGSTSMIGDAHLVDVNYIQFFEFDRSPLEVLDQAVQWAEQHLQKRSDAYKVYPGRK